MLTENGNFVFKIMRYGNVIYIENEVNTLMQAEISEVNSFNDPKAKRGVFEFHLFYAANPSPFGDHALNFVIEYTPLGGLPEIIFKEYSPLKTLSETEINERSEFTHKQYQLSRNRGFLWMIQDLNEKLPKAHFIP